MRWGGPVIGQCLTEDGVGLGHQLLQAHQVTAGFQLAGRQGHIQKVCDGFHRA